MKKKIIAFIASLLVVVTGVTIATQTGILEDLFSPRGRVHHAWDSGGAVFNEENIQSDLSAIPFYANEKRVIFNSAQPIVYDGKWYVPLRDTAEALGFTVDWNDKGIGKNITVSGYGWSEKLTGAFGQDTKYSMVRDDTQYVQIEFFTEKLGVEMNAKSGDGIYLKAMEFIRRDENGVAHLTKNDYSKLFDLQFKPESSDSLFVKAAYWTAKIEQATYGSFNANKALSFLGFENVHSFEKYRDPYNMRVDCGVMEIPTIPSANKLLCLSFRGTTNVTDWYRNLHFAGVSPIPSKPNLQLHYGFYEGIWYAFKEDLSKKIEVEYGIDVFADTDVAILIIGHSLGGAYAEILSFYLMSSGTVPSKHVIAFGHASPLVGNIDCQTYSVKNGMGARIQKIACTQDIVPFIGYKGFKGYTLSANPFGFGFDDGKHANPVWFHELQNTYIPYLKGLLVG